MTGRWPLRKNENQALAINVEDGSVVYDVAFALVWAEDGPVDTTNEAYAFASCRDCTAVAVGFQVVLVLGQADVVVPQNLSAAANYNCIECVTYALASQLVLTLDGPLSDAGMDELEALWEEIAAYGRSLEDVPLDEIQGRLNDYKARILGIIEKDVATSGETTSTETESDTEPDTEGEPQPAPGSTTVAPEPDNSDPDSSTDAIPPADTGAEPQPTPAQEPTGEPAPDTATSPPAPLTTSTPQPVPATAPEQAPAPAPADEPAPAPTG